MVPFAISGGGSAAIVASMTRWSLLGPLHGPVAVVVGAIAGAAIGDILARVSLGRQSVLPLAAVIAVLGPVSGLVIGVACDPSLLGLAIISGAALGIVMLPVLLSSVWLLRRASVQRDTRAPLRLSGVWLSVASAIGVTLFSIYRRPWWTSEECVTLARVPLVHALVGCGIVCVVAVLDGFAENEIATIQVAPQLDPGASWWLTHIGTPRPRSRASDVERAHGLLAASRQSRIAIVVAILAVAPTLFAYARFAVE